VEFDTTVFTKRAPGRVDFRNVTPSRFHCQAECGQRRILVWYAGFADHCTPFPTASVIAAFKTELVGYKTSKDTIQFRLDKRLPVRRLIYQVPTCSQPGGATFVQVPEEAMASSNRVFAGQQWSA
jgi:hypothetical protein